MRLHPRQGTLHLCFVSGAVLLAFMLCEAVHIMSHLDARLHPHPHPVFLPYGVFVVATWIYGWIALPLLLPAALLSRWLLAGSFAFDPLVILVILGFKLAAVPLTFDLFRLAGLDVRGAGSAANWKLLVAVGLIASIVGNVLRVMIGPCCDGMQMSERAAAYVDAVAGDMAGLILVLLAVMMIFRVLRHG